MMVGAVTQNVITRKQLEDCAAILFATASTIGKQEGLDPLDMAAALGFAMTRMIYFGLGRQPDQCLQAAKIMADTSMKSMADILSGQESLDTMTQ
jgi:hypothetical protein